MDEENGLEKSINRFMGAKTWKGKTFWFLTLSHLVGGATRKDQEWVAERVGLGKEKAYYFTLGNAFIIGPTFAAGYYLLGQSPGWFDNQIADFVDKPAETVANSYVKYVLAQGAIRGAYAVIRKKSLMSWVPWGVISTAGWRVGRKIAGK